MGMQNMRSIMPTLQKAVVVQFPQNGLRYSSVITPKQQRETRIVKDKTSDEIAREIVHWIKEE